MRYRVADLLKSSLGRTQVVDLDVWPEFEGQGFEFAEPVSGQLRFIRDPGGILVEGDLRTRVTLSCARCLSPVAVALELHLSEHFRPTVTIPLGPPIEPNPNEEQESITDLDGQHTLDAVS